MVPLNKIIRGKIIHFDMLAFCRAHLYLASATASTSLQKPQRCKNPCSCGRVHRTPVPAGCCRAKCLPSSAPMQFGSCHTSKKSSADACQSFSVGERRQRGASRWYMASLTTYIITVAVRGAMRYDFAIVFMAPPATLYVVLSGPDFPDLGH